MQVWVFGDMGVDLPVPASSSAMGKRPYSARGKCALQATEAHFHFRRLSRPKCASLGQP